MLFNSFNFALFLPIVFVLYWGVFNKKLITQNIFLVIISYTFYGFWSWKFLSLIFFSSLVDFTIGKQLGKTENENHRKYLLWASLGVNLGLLLIFKYFNFFTDSLIDLCNIFGLTLDYFTVNIILPVGISFYTFQTLSYTIDIYRRQLKPTQDIISFFAFVSFFPQLVAGPVERAANLLPQFLKERVFNKELAFDGSRQIFWGLFKKVVVADNCAVLVNQIFDNYEAQPGSILIIGAILFAFQVYCDFSGYSDIAIGVAKLLGFKLMTNFKTPYFSKNFGEFWKRWHISLSSWILDYAYNPLVLNKRRWGIYGIVFSSIVTFTLMGLWHGPAWHYVVFGFVLGLYLAFEALTKKQRKKIRRASNKYWYLLISRLLTFVAWCFACVLFRVEYLGDAFHYYKSIIFNQFLPSDITIFNSYRFIVLFIIVLLIFDWIYKDEEHNFPIDKIKNYYYRHVIYLSVFLLLIIFAGKQEEFIYFQF